MRAGGMGLSQAGYCSSCAVARCLLSRVGPAASGPARSRLWRPHVIRTSQDIAPGWELWLLWLVRMVGLPGHRHRGAELRGRRGAAADVHELGPGPGGAGRAARRDEQVDSLEDCVYFEAPAAGGGGLARRAILPMAQGTTTRRSRSAATWMQRR